MRLWAVLFFVTCFATSAQAQASANPPHALFCIFDRQFMCAPVMQQCTKVKPANSQGWSLIDFDSGTYSICEPTGCRTLNAGFQQDGIYVDISIPGAAMAKLEAGTNRLMEVTTVLLGTFVAYLNCHPAK